MRAAASHVAEQETPMEYNMLPLEEQELCHGRLVPSCEHVTCQDPKVRIESVPVAGVQRYSLVLYAFGGFKGHSFELVAQALR